MDADLRRLNAEADAGKQAAAVASRDPETYAILGAAMEVHRELGCGFLEAVYVEALAHEFEERRIPYEREKAMPVRYKSRLLASNYRADFICFGAVIVEAKALASLGGIEQAQLLNYLKASGLPRGLLVNFGARSLEWKRMVVTLHATAAKADKPADPQISQMDAGS